MTPDTDGYLTHRQILVVMGGLMVGLFLSALDQSIVGTALPRITSELGGFDKLSWVVTAYLLTATASTPLWGKISDLYGRRLLFQIAIVTFLVGSLLAGSSQDINQLIASRAVHGLGGGGLLALAMATIGDVIPPRERGRYRGYFAAVFGTSSVLGPVLGGWFTEGPGWEWIFFINVPLGLVALVVTSAALKIPHLRREHSIDYLGAAVVVGSVTSILLYTAWVGPELGWRDATSVALLLTCLVLAIVFVLVELRATEPIIPMRLFRNSIFSIANLFGFMIGIAMPGRQREGADPIRPGDRRGLGVSRAGMSMFVMGLGLGLTMQVLIVVVQNSVDRSDMGVATASVAFFRQMGGSFGTALLGAVLSSRLAVHLADRMSDLPPRASVAVGDPADLANDVTAIQQLPARLNDLVTGAFSDALRDMFLSAVPLVLIALAVAFFLKEVPLGTRQDPAVPTPVGPPAQGGTSAVDSSAGSSPTSV